MAKTLATVSTISDWSGNLRDNHLTLVQTTLFFRHPNLWKFNRVRSGYRDFSTGQIRCVVFSRLSIGVVQHQTSDTNRQTQYESYLSARRGSTIRTRHISVRYFSFAGRAIRASHYNSLFSTVLLFIGLAAARNCNSWQPEFISQQLQMQRTYQRWQSWVKLITFANNFPFARTINRDDSRESMPAYCSWQ